MNKLQKNYKQAMLHKIACLLLLILGVINTVKGQENTFTDEQFVYKLYSNEAKPFQLVDPKRENYVIPEEIKVDGRTYKIILGWDVRAANLSPFNENQYVKSVTLPNIETYINSMFWGCSKLESLIIPKKIKGYDKVCSKCTSLNSVTIQTTADVGRQAFSECSSLKSVVIPDDVKEIGAGAFANCTQLTNVSIPNSVTIIEDGKHIPSSSPGLSTDEESFDGVFEGCTSLTTVQLPASLNKIGAYLFYSSGITDIKLTSSMNEIGIYAFSKCTSLNKDITIPTSITNIGTKAFAQSGITGITIPKNTNMGESSFYNCTNLHRVSVPVNSLNYSFRNCTALTSLELIGEDTKKTTLIAEFEGCTSLESVTIPEGIDYIRNAFSGCSALKELQLPSTLQEIGGFEGCSSLEHISLPSNVTRANFYQATNLSSIQLPEGITSINLSYTNISEISLPNSVENVALDHTPIKEVVFPKEGSCQSCSLLEKVTFGGNKIKYYAFSGCTSLKEIHLKSTSGTSFQNNSFGGVDKSSCIVYVPVGSLNNYINWAGFSDIREEGATGPVIPKEHTITYELQNVICDPMPEKIKDKQEFKTYLTGTYGYLLPERAEHIAVTMGGKLLTMSTDFQYIRGTKDTTLTIPSVTGDLKITIIGQIATTFESVGVTYNLQHVIAPYAPERVKKGEKFQFSLLVDDDYSLPEKIVVTMGGKTLLAGTDYTYEIINGTKLHGLMTIENVTAELSISATATPKGEKPDKPTPPAIGDTLVENGLRYQITSASTATLLGPYFDQDLADWPVKDCKIKTDIAVNENVFHVTAIAPNAFSGATQLTSILISGNIETIGLEAFYRCYSLTSLSIPESVKSIENEENEPFFPKLDLHSITVEQGNTVYASENGILYDKQKKTLLHCPTLYANPIRIPSTVTTIRPYAFAWCEGITTLTFPEGVTTVGECALNGCESLTSLYIPASIRKIDLLADDSDNALSALKQIHCAQADPSLIALAPGVFDYIDCSACTLYVPKGAKSKYATAPEWKRFTTIIEEGDEEELPENIPTVGIGMNRAAVVMYVGEEVELTASVVPDNATEQGVIWEYSNPALIKKTAKGILALAPGELLITVRTENRKFSTQCGVTILQKAIEPEIENKTDNSVTVSWEQVEEADKYLLNVYSDSGKKDLFAQYKFDASGSLLKSSLFFSHTITGLVPGTTFYIETIAYKTISDRYIPVAQNTITVQTSGTSTAIESIARETQLAIQEGRVTIYPYEPINIAVISINGKYIFNGKINEVTTIPVPLPGIYIVTFIKDEKNISRKIIVP